jgi:membrane-bound serine protease (ClpP class)
MTAGWLEHAATLVANPVVAPVLLCLGFLGLLEEIRTPSFGMAGTAGLLALALFFGSHVVVGLAGVGDLLVFGGGLVLLGIEIFVIPGFGVVGVLGIGGTLAGIYMSLLGASPTTSDYLQAAAVLAFSVLITLLAAWALLRSLPPAARAGGHGIFLPHRGEGGLGLEPERRRAELVGLEGAAITDLRPSGTALFGDERLEVVSGAEWIPAGTPIRIVSAEGYRRVVRPLEAPPPP